MWMLYPDKFTRSCIFSPMSTDSPRIPHRASTGYKRDSVNRALFWVCRGVNRFIGVYRVISRRERKRTQVLRDFSRGTSAIFVNVPRFIVVCRLFIGNLTHTKDPRQTHDTSGVGRVYSVGGGGGVFIHASALLRYVRVYIGSNSAGNRG